MADIINLTPTGGKCSNCGKPAVQAYRPFCSKRCAEIDLGRWINGSYAIPMEVDADEDGDSVAEIVDPLDEIRRR